MLVVSTREFRKKKSYKIVPVSDDTFMTKDDFFAKIDRSLKQAHEGKITTVNSIEELNTFLDSL